MKNFARTLLVAGALVASIATAAPAFAGVWDSIAVDDNMSLRAGEAGYGVGTGDSKADAEHAAMHKCHHSGNDACQVVATFKTCGAYASSKKHAGVGYGDSKRAASAAAVAKCGTDTCQVLVADCVGR